MSSNPNTPRRSKRFQPFYKAPREDSEPPSSSNISWCLPCAHVRSANPDLDLLEEEKDEENMYTRTTFYEAFEMKARLKRPFRKNGRLNVPGERQREDSEVEKYHLGDTVLISTSSRFPSVGVIVAMWECSSHGSHSQYDEARMRIRVRWFLRPTQLPNTRAKRIHLENEIYFSIDSSDILPPSSILSHCRISTEPPVMSTTRGKPTSRRSGVDEAELFYCHLAIDSQRGLYYDFNWTTHRTLALTAASEIVWGDVARWNITVKDVTSKRSRPKNASPRPRKRRKPEESVPSDNDVSGDEGGDQMFAPTDELSDSSSVSESDDEKYDREPKTPSKKRTRSISSPTKRNAPTTPRRPRSGTLAHPTPHSKAALLKRTKAKQKQKTAVRPAAPAFQSRQLEGLENLPRDPWLRAMHLLHVGSRPDALPCREEEYDKVLRSVEELLEEGSGGCVYISGVPGTGKTATVHAIVRDLKRMAEQNETNPFTYVEINGLKIPEASASYNLLWEAVSGHDIEKEGHLRISAKESLKLLTRHFSGSAKGPGGHACVVLMDELDQLMTAKQDVVYNFFNWPTLVGSKLIVLAVANTMDLPERAMTGRVRSRLGMTRINFQPYNTKQLETIVQTRLLSAKESLGSDAQDVISPDGIKFAAMKVSSISGDARRVLDICRRAVELVQARKRTAKTEDVKEVIKVLQNSPTAAYLRECSFHERMMLASLVKCIKREGVDEIKWGDVQHQHFIYMNVLPGPSDPTRKPTDWELSMVLDSLLASRAMLMEEGATASRKPEGERRVILNLEQSEVERVLSEVGGHTWKNVLSV